MKIHRYTRGSRFAIAVLTVAAGAAHADTFSNDQFETGSEILWHNSAQLVVQGFNAAFASTGDLMQIGIPGSAGNSIIFDDPNAVLAYLPAIGPPGILTQDLLDPTESPSGVYGGETAALTLTVDFNDAGLFKGTSAVPFGDLLLTGLTGDQAFLNGSSVRKVLSDANIFLGGSYQPAFSYLDFYTTVDDINNSFNGGPVSSWADQHLELPSSNLTAAPEIDPASVGTAVTLLVGTLAVLGERRRRFPVAG